MSIRQRYMLFISVQHLVLFGLSIFLFDRVWWVILIAEAVLLTSLGFSLRLMGLMYRPLELIRQCRENTREREFNLHFVPTGIPEMDDLVSLFNHLFTQLRAEKIANLEQFYLLEKLIRYSPMGILLLDPDDKVICLNPAACIYLCLDEDTVKGQPLSGLTSPLAEILKSLEINDRITAGLDGLRVYRCQKGHFFNRGFTHSFLTIEELTDEVYRKERESYTKLIRVISHEINNSVGSVNSLLGSLEIFGEQIDPACRGDYTLALETAIDRNRHLNRFMQNLSDVAKIPPPRTQVVDLHAILRNIGILFAEKFARLHITCVQEPVSEIFLVSLDPHQMEQVIINIVKNAVEAAGEFGRIEVKTLIDPERCLEIRDSGPDIPDHIRSQLFTPFFSTKEAGQGLGLTVVREILTNHGFLFTLAREGSQTVFRIRFGSD